MPLPQTAAVGPLQSRATRSGAGKGQGGAGQGRGAVEQGGGWAGQGPVPLFIWGWGGEEGGGCT